MKHIRLLFFALFSSALSVLSGVLNKKTNYKKSGIDLIVFTFDRPLQFYALIKSIRSYITGVGNIYVIMRASSDEYVKAYSQIAGENPELIWLKQGNTKKNFKVLLERALCISQAPYFMFTVDDSIVKDYVNLIECAEHLKAQQAYGFYLRLGTHLTRCHPKNCLQAVPPYKKINDQVILWHMRCGEHDWNYPGMLDMTIYPACKHI